MANIDQLAGLVEGLIKVMHQQAKELEQLWPVSGRSRTWATTTRCP